MSLDTPQSPLHAPVSPCFVVNNRTFTTQIGFVSNAVAAPKKNTSAHTTQNVRLLKKLTRKDNKNGTYSLVQNTSTSSPRRTCSSDLQSVNTVSLAYYNYIKNPKENESLKKKTDSMNHSQKKVQPPTGRIPSNVSPNTSIQRPHTTFSIHPLQSSPNRTTDSTLRTARRHLEFNLE